MDQLTQPCLPCLDTSRDNFHLITTNQSAQPPVTKSLMPNGFLVNLNRGHPDMTVSHEHIDSGPPLQESVYFEAFTTLMHCRDTVMSYDGRRDWFAPSLL